MRLLHMAYIHYLLNTVTFKKHDFRWSLRQKLRIYSRNCVIPVVRVRTLGSVGSQTQLSLRCNFSDYVLGNNYMFRPMVAIFRLSWEYLRATSLQ